MKQVGLKEGPDGGLRYRDTYYPGTESFEEAEPVEAKPGLETNNIRIPVTTEKTYSITGAVVGTGKAAELKHSSAHVDFTKRSGAAQNFGDNSNTGRTMLGPDGSFTIRRLSPGEYTLSAVTVDHDEGRAIDEGYASVRVVDSDIRVNIEIGRSAELRGNVKVRRDSLLPGRKSSCKRPECGFTRLISIPAADSISSIFRPVSTRFPCGTVNPRIMSSRLCVQGEITRRSRWN